MQIICHRLNEEDFQVEFIDHKIFLGRDGSNSIPIAAEGVSRYHAILIEDGEELFIQDNDSLNGTFLNYKQIRSRRRLAHGDVIQIGFRLIKVVFLTDRRVVLDFVPPEQMEIVSDEEASVPSASPVPDRPSSDGDDPGHSVSSSKTTIPGPSSPAPGQMPFSGEDAGHPGRAAETMLSGPPSSNMPFPGGREIGKYVIIKRIGKGGMGEVYLARHKTLGIFRAIKVLSNNHGEDNRKFLERFIREAKLASEIRHPNVVGVMDVETDSSCGVPYIVMEYVDGGSLRNSIVASGRLSEEQAVVIVEAVASALQAAEEHGIVHRDIKPDNIMFTKRGEVKLADLGIAKSGEWNADLTKTNMMVGTPAYLPPEQARNAKGVDARADIYGLGATFYEMLTGQQPYPGENSIEVLHKLFLEPVPDPRKINPNISPASASIVMKMMAKAPKDRFQNADELLAVMERTFPPHTPHEAGELVKMVIAGECQDSPAFSSGISSSTLSLWWGRVRNKRLVLLLLTLFLANCLVCAVFLFLEKWPGMFFSGSADAEVAAAGKTEAVGDPSPETDAAAFARNVPSVPGTDAEDALPAPDPDAEDAPSVPDPDAEDAPSRPDSDAEDAPSVPGTDAEDAPSRPDSDSEDAPSGPGPVSVQGKTYELKIKTTPDSDIRFIYPDGRMLMFSADPNGQLTIPGLESGNYKIRVSRDRYQELSSDFKVKGDLTLNLPLDPIAGSSSAKPEKDPYQGKTYDLRIKTTPDSEIRLVCPDGATKYFVPERNGQFILPELRPGNYRVIVSNDHYEGLTRDVVLNGSKSINMMLKPGPLVVTTSQDISSRQRESSRGVSGEKSLREAVDYMSNHGGSSIVFDKDYEITLLNPLVFRGNRAYTIDGESKNVTLIANGTSFDVGDSSLRLVNLSVRTASNSSRDSYNSRLRNYTNSISIASANNSGSMEFVSVVDDGRFSWDLSNNKTLLAGSSHLHNFTNGNGKNRSAFFSVRIDDGAILDNSSINSVEYNVYGLLRNAFIQKTNSNSGFGHVVVYKGGICENLSVGSGIVEHYGGGTINGMKVLAGCVYGYEPNAVLKGTVIIGGPALEPEGASFDRPIVGEETDVVFDLSSRTERTVFRSDDFNRRIARDVSLKPGYPQQCSSVIQNMKAFLGARSYTIRVNPSQEYGTYCLAGNAADFSSPMSLEVNQTMDEPFAKAPSDAVPNQRGRREEDKRFYQNAISVGESFTANNRTYSLSLTNDPAGGATLTLTIRKPSK